MSQTRQSVSAGTEGILVRTLSLKFRTGHLIDGHAHTWGQLIFASRGVMQVDAAGSRWAVPPMRCLWVPAGIEHKIRIVGETWMRTLYIEPDSVRGLPDECKALNVSSFLREIILEVVRLKILVSAASADLNLANVLLDQLAVAVEIPLKITMPTDPRAVRLANIISRDPAERKPINSLAKAAGASTRTLERLFARETGMSAGRWRKRARLMKAITMLVEGRSVLEASSESGYESPSAFIAAFKRETGITPGQYIDFTQRHYRHS